jgi:hypothetical protein
MQWYASGFNMPPNAHHYTDGSGRRKRIHVDFAGPFLGMMILVIVGAHSKWPEVIIMHSKTTTSKLARNGLPE